MTKNEFTQWYEDYCSAFPGVDEWLVKHSPNIGRTLERWHEALQNIPLHVAFAVTNQMVGGVIEPIKAYERELTPQHVRACAAKLLSKENEREKTLATRSEYERAHERHGPQRWQMGDVYRRILKVRDENPGATTDEICAMVWPDFNEV